MNWWKKQRSANSLNPSRGSSSAATSGAATEGAVNGKPKSNGDRTPNIATKITVNEDQALGFLEREEFNLWPEAQRAPGDKPGLKAYVVPRGYRVTGELFSRYRRVIIEGELASGRLEGQVVRVARGGVVRADLDVDVLQVAGLVDAPVCAKLGVQVSSSGELSGRVKAPNVGVASGAKLSELEVEVG